TFGDDRPALYLGHGRSPHEHGSPAVQFCGVELDARHQPATSSQWNRRAVASVFDGWPRSQNRRPTIAASFRQAVIVTRSPARTLPDVDTGSWISRATASCG